jgi:CheY-like chemotaxis protein
MVNLLSNAAKYTPSGGNIWLTTEVRRGEAVIRVRDDGIGLPADMLTGIFELFTQVGTTGTSAGGLGLGLALVQRLVDLHGGAVTAHSEGPGTGSEFVVRLPARKLAGGEARTLPQPEPSGGGRRVLVVDDNTDAAAGVALLLERLGYRVTTAPDGASALEAARDFEPEIVLLDIGMPGMNGYETARRLREQPGGDGRRVVAITGWSHDQARHGAAAAGFDQFLTKPVDVRTLSMVLNTAPRS